MEETLISSFLRLEKNSDLHQLHSVFELIQYLLNFFIGGEVRGPQLSDEPRPLRGLPRLQISRIHRVRLRLRPEKEGEKMLTK